MEPDTAQLPILLILVAIYAITEFLAARLIAGDLEMRAKLQFALRIGFVQLILLLLLTAPFITVSTFLFLLITTIISRMIDIRWFKKASTDPHILEKYLFKQIVIFCILYGVYYFHSPIVLHRWYSDLINVLLNEPEPLIQFVSSHLIQIITSLIGAVFVIDGGTQLVRGILTKFPALSRIALLSLQPDNVVQENQTDNNAGEWIGILERLLVFIFVLVEGYMAIAFVLTAKSIARFRELENKQFAEYYLIGTTASVLIAVITGLLVRVVNAYF